MSKKKTQEVSDIDEMLSKSEALFVKYQKAIIGGIVAVVAIIAAYFAYTNLYAEPREQKANEALFRGQQYFEAGNYESALNGDKAGFEGFAQVASNYSSTAAGNLAQLYAGICLAKEGKYQEAIPYLEDYSSCGDAMVSPAAHAALGHCYAATGDVEKGAKALVDAAEDADNNALSPIYLIEAGELYETLGQNDKALKLYKTVQEKYYNSPAYRNIDKYIERVSK